MAFVAAWAGLCLALVVRGAAWVAPAAWVALVAFVAPVALVGLAPSSELLVWGGFD